MKKYFAFFVIIAVLSSCSEEKSRFFSLENQDCDVNDFEPMCVNNNSLTCTDSKTKIEQCDQICDKGKCVQCTERNTTECIIMKDANITCSADGKCLYSCKDGYKFNDNETECVPSACEKDYHSCIDGKHHYCEDGVIRIEDCPQLCENQRCVECTKENTSRCHVPDNANVFCTNDNMCDFECTGFYRKNSTGDACESFICDETDDSRCPQPEHSTRKCVKVEASSNEEGEGDDEQNSSQEAYACGFDCNDKYTKNTLATECVPFVCDETHLEECANLHPDNAHSTCVKNTCSYECDPGFILFENKCIQCNLLNMTQCPSVSNATTICVDNQCDFECQNIPNANPCYIKDKQSCEPIDLNNNGTLDCLESIDCSASNIICINDANDFLEIPNILKNGKVELFGKDEENVTFYLMNDINLALADSIETEGTSNECKSVNWKYIPEMKNLTLTTPYDLTKTITYQNQKGYDCDLPAALFNKLTDSNISNITLRLNFNGTKIYGSLANSISHTHLNNITFAGSITSTSNSNHIGGIIGTADNSEIKDSVCDGASLTISNPASSGYYVGGIVGSANATKITTGDRINLVTSIDSSLSAGGLAGILKGNSTVTKATNNCQTLKSKQYVGGFAYKIENSHVSDVTNTIGSIDKIYSEPTDTQGGCGGFVYTCKFTTFSDEEPAISKVVNNVKSITAPGDKTAAGFLAGSENALYSDIVNTVENIQGNYAAGFVSKPTNSVFTNVTNQIGTVEGAAGVGGFFRNSYESKYSNIQNTIDTVKGNLGGGFGEFASQYNTSYTGQVISQIGNQLHDITSQVKLVSINDEGEKPTSYAGGFIGYITGVADVQRIDSHVDRMKTHSSNVGGFTGYISHTADITNTFSDINTIIDTLESRLNPNYSTSSYYISAFSGFIKNGANFDRIYSQANIIAKDKSNGMGFGYLYGDTKAQTFSLNNVFVNAKIKSNTNYGFALYNPSTYITSIKLHNIVSSIRIFDANETEVHTKLFGSINNNNTGIPNTDLFNIDNAYFFVHNDNATAVSNTDLNSFFSKIATLEDTEAAIEKLNSTQSDVVWTKADYILYGLVPSDDIKFQLPSFTPKIPADFTILEPDTSK